MRNFIMNVPMNMRDKANEIINLYIDEDLKAGCIHVGMHAMTQEGHLKSTVSETTVSIEYIRCKIPNSVR